MAASSTGNSNSNGSLPGLPGNAHAAPTARAAACLGITNAPVLGVAVKGREAVGTITGSKKSDNSTMYLEMSWGDGAKAKYTLESVYSPLCTLHAQNIVDAKLHAVSNA